MGLPPCDRVQMAFMLPRLLVAARLLRFLEDRHQDVLLSCRWPQVSEVQSAGFTPGEDCWADHTPLAVLR